MERMYRPTKDCIDDKGGIIIPHQCHGKECEQQCGIMKKITVSYKNNIA